MTDTRAPIRVVYDVNVYLDHIRSGAGMLLPDRLPSASASSDALSLAFDQQIVLFASPHILRNINRVMRLDGQSERITTKFIEFIAEACDDSGGAIVDPFVRDHAIGDYEDNSILALAKDPAVDADVIVSSDKHLLDIGPAWNGRLIMRPRNLVSRVMQSSRAAVPPAVQVKPSASQPAPHTTSNARRFPELAGVRVATGAAGRYPELATNNNEAQENEPSLGLG